jgi:hypothetical protein
MPIKLSAIQPAQDTKDITLDFGEAGTIEMTVIPDKFTVGRQRKLHKAIKDNDQAGQVDMMFDVVKKWDLTDDAGKPLPLTQKGIDQLRTETVTAIAKKMSEALGAPKSETSNG